MSQIDYETLDWITEVNGRPTDGDWYIERLVPITVAKRVLGVGWKRVIEIIQDRDLVVYNVGRERLSLNDITEETRGLRTTVEALRDYINSLEVRDDE